MAQYCRYCEYAYLERDGLYCQKKSECMTMKQCKHTNNCKMFNMNFIDVLRLNGKGYSPTGIKPVELGGLGKQIKMEDLLKGSVSVK